MDLSPIRAERAVGDIMLGNRVLAARPAGDELGVCEFGKPKAAALLV